MVLNQKLILVLVGLLLGVQVFSLITRIIYESISLDIVEDISIYIQQNNGTEARISALATMNSTVTASQAGTSDASVIAMSFFGAVYIFTCSVNLAVITLIVTFVSFVFFKTIKKGGTISKGHYVFLSIFGDVFGLFVFVVLCVISFTLGIVYFLVAIGQSPDFQAGLYIGVYVPYVVQILLQTILFNFSAIKVLVIISKNSNSQNKGQYQKPFFKVISVQIILTLCAFIQILATSVGLIQDWPYSKLLFFILNNVGILSFAIVAISLYNPLFTIDPSKSSLEKQLNATLSSPRSEKRVQPSCLTPTTTKDSLLIEMKNGVVSSPTTSSTPTTTSAYYSTTEGESCSEFPQQQV